MKAAIGKLCVIDLIHPRREVAAMKLQFSLATLLVCMTVLAVVCAICVQIPVREEGVRSDSIDGNQ